MVNLNRVWAVFLRYLVPSFGQRLTSIVYWLTLNIVIWGSTSAWIQQKTNIPNLVSIIITGFIFWQIVFRVNLETSKSLYEEITSQNLVNLFASPLKMSEWILGVMLVGLIDAFFVIMFGSLFAAYFYGINLFSLGINLIFSALLLTMSGWFIGFLICSLVILKGKKAQDFVYSIGYIFAPFSCISYPLNSQLMWIQKISALLPTTYVFENIRYTISAGDFSPALLFKSFSLNIVYLALSISLFIFLFRLRKKASLASF